MAKIFLCYAREDEAQVREVYQRLKAEGFEPWMDKMNLLPGQRWRLEIPRALRASDFVLVFLSQHSATKQGFVQREFKLALDILEEMPEGVIHTIPIRLNNWDVPESFHDLQWCNLFEEDVFERLSRAMQTRMSRWQQEDATASVVAMARVLIQDIAPRLTTTLPASFTNSIGMEFVLIQAGTFLMGSNRRFSNEKPVHRVTISQPFYLGTDAVTQGQWEKVMGTNPSWFTGDRNRPVEHVSWKDTQEFIRRLNMRQGGTNYRLPTEAEWEYACRAGSQTAFSFGDDSRQLSEYGWYAKNSGTILWWFGKTRPVGQLKPNAWGLHT